jgi:perosamine synthetase
MSIKLNKNIPFFTPEISSEEIKSLNKTVKDGWISSQGKIIERFEKEFAKFHKIKYALSTSNCTTSLHLSLLSLNIKKDDEIICPNLTFIAPANMIKHTGAKLVLVDVERDNFCICLKDLKKKITKKTKAIMIVHPFGYPVDINKVKKIVQNKNIKIIEDVAESIGAKVNNKLCGTMGDVSCFSFFANKIITTGEGGMILTNKKKIYEKAKILRDHGMSNKKRYFHKFLGFNYRMTSMQAAIGIVQLKKLKKILERKKLIKNHYVSYLKAKTFEIFPKVKNMSSVEWFVTITFKKKKLRNRFIKYMMKNKIECRPMIFPVSFAKHFRDYYNKKNYINSYNISLNSVHLPSSLNLNLKDIRLISACINRWEGNIKV